MLRNTEEEEETKGAVPDQSPMLDIEMSADVNAAAFDLSATQVGSNMVPGTQPLTSSKANNLLGKKTERISDYGSTQQATILPETLGRDLEGDARTQRAPQDKTDQIVEEGGESDNENTSLVNKHANSSSVHIAATSESPDVVARAF